MKPDEIGRLRSQTAGRHGEHHSGANATTEFDSTATPRPRKPRKTDQTRNPIRTSRSFAGQRQWPRDSLSRPKKFRTCVAAANIITNCLSLHEIRHRHSNFDHAAYTEAFREYGIDVESLDPLEAAECIRARTIRVELTLALDLWVGVRSGTREADNARRNRLLAVNRVADPDELRNKIRDVHEQGQSRVVTRQALSIIAAAAKISDLPVQTISLLAGGMTIPRPGRAGELRRAS